MAKLSIHMSSGSDKSTSNNQKSISVNYLYCYNGSNVEDYKSQKTSYNELLPEDGKENDLLFALNYTNNEKVNEITIPQPVGVINSKLKIAQKRSIYKREVWHGNSNTPIAEKVYHPVVLNQQLERIIDYNIGTNRRYEYIIYSTEEPSAKQLEFYFPITTKWDFWSITELHRTDEENVYSTSENDVWLFKFNVEPGDQQQNMSKNQQDSLGKFPVFSYGKKNYISSSVSCLLGSEMLPYDYAELKYELTKNDDGNVVFVQSQVPGYNDGGYTESRWRKLLWNCGEQQITNIFDTKISSNDSVDMLNEWKKVCNSGNPKLYKNSKGQTFIIQITESSNTINESWDKQPIAINFSWVEIEDASNIRIIQTDNFTSDTTGENTGGGEVKMIDYNSLANKPSINGVELQGNKSEREFELEGESNVKTISGSSESIILDNNITYNLGSINSLTTEFGTMADEYYVSRQSAQCEINFNASINFQYTPPSGVTFIGYDVSDNKLNAKAGSEYNIGFGYVDGSLYAVCGKR